MRYGDAFCWSGELIGVRFGGSVCGSVQVRNVRT
jgi:hypothetical protein